MKPTHYSTKAEALREAREQQDKFLCAIMVVELTDDIFIIVPHRDEARIAYGKIHYPTPKGEPILPKKKVKKRKAITNCPSCGKGSQGLCTDCKKVQIEKYRVLHDLQVNRTDNTKS